MLSQTFSAEFLTVLSSYLFNLISQTEMVRSSLHETNAFSWPDQNNLLTDVPCPACRALSITFSNLKVFASHTFMDLSMLQVAKYWPFGLNVMWFIVNRCAMMLACSS